MDKEIESSNENKTWELVKKVPNEKVLDVKWVYSKKSDDIYKARLVVREFQQTNVTDGIYAPVAKMKTLKCFFFLFIPVWPNYRTDGCSNGIFKWRSKLGGIYLSTERL